MFFAKSSSLAFGHAQCICNIENGSTLAYQVNELEADHLIALIISPRYFQIKIGNTSVKDFGM
jgi:hypothetical protein